MFRWRVLQAAAHIVGCMFLHCPSVICMTCMSWRHSPALTHSLTAHGLTTDNLWRGIEHPVAEGRDRSFYMVSVTTIRRYVERMRYLECSRM